MQWHSSFTHIHIIHCTTETSRPSEPSELPASTHPQSTFPAAQTRVRRVPGWALPITNMYGQKKRKNLQAYVSDSWSWTRRGSRGDTFPDGFSPTLTPYAPAKRLQLSSHTSGCLSDPTQPNMSQTLHGCPKALPCSDSLSKILPVSLRANFPFLLSYPSSSSLASYC